MKAILTAAAAVAGFAAFAAPALAQGGSGERVSRVIVYGTDPCPRGPDGDIIICGRRPERERYRIPQELREGARTEDPESTSWAARAESLEYVGRTGIESCSTVGPGGFTGCWAEMMRTARGDRRQGDGEPGR
jgi:hypothetical protein